MEILLNDLEQVWGLFFASPNMFFLNLHITFGVVVACTLNNRTSIRRCHQLRFITYLLNWFCQSISFNQSVAVCQIGFINWINLVLYISKATSCSLKQDQMILNIYIYIYGFWICDLINDIYLVNMFMWHSESKKILIIA